MLTGWNFEDQLDFASQSLSAAFTNKVVAVHLTSASTRFWANVKSDGTDVRLTLADDTLLNFEIRSFDFAGKDAIYHAQVPTFNATTTTSIKIQYGNASATSGESITATYITNYKGVWHLDQNKAAGAFVDSTANANNGTNNGTTDAAGQIGRGRQFTQASSQYISIPDNNSLTFGDGTNDTPMIGSMWINPTNINGFRILTKGTGTVDSEYGFTTTGTGELTLIFYSSGSTSSEIRGKSNAVISTGMQQVGFYYDGSGSETGIVIYNNGAVMASTGSTAGTYVAMSNQASVVQIGKWITGLYADGVINETILRDATGLTSTTALDWIKLEHASGVGTWMTITELGGGSTIALTGSFAAQSGSSGALTIITPGIVNMVGSFAAQSGSSGALTVTGSNVLFGVGNFPQGVATEYEIRDSAGAIITAWTNTGVLEVAGPSKSGYIISTNAIGQDFKGTIYWRTPDLSKEAFEPINLNITAVNMRGTEGANTVAPLALAEIEATTVLAKEMTLTTMKGAAFNGNTDSLKAIRDRGDVAWTTGPGGGGGGGTDWTDTERRQLRHRLGIDGLTDPPATNIPDLPVDLNKISGDAQAAANLKQSALALIVGNAITGILTSTKMTTNLTEPKPNHFNGRALIWVTGPLKGQAKKITGYDENLRMLIFSMATMAPVAGDLFVIV